MKLMTKTIEKKFEKYPLYSQDGKGKEAEVIVKYFNPSGVGTWLITEANKMENGDYEMYGYIELGYEWEWGYVLLSQLENIRLPYGLKIERDMYCGSNKKVKDLARGDNYEF